MNSLTIKFSNGYEIELVEYFEHLSNWYLDSELETRQWIIDNVKPDWVCIEVGAHIGYTSMLLGELSSYVIAFEANPHAHAMALKNIEHNRRVYNRKYDNIAFYNCAVGNVNGRMDETLWFAGEDKLFGETHGTFDFVTIDDFLYEELERLDLLFIDADGWDYDVIMGAQKHIRDYHPAIIMEANYALKWRGHSYEDIHRFAEQFGYTEKWLDRGCPGNVLLC